MDKHRLGAVNKNAHGADAASNKGKVANPYRATRSGADRYRGASRVCRYGPFDSDTTDGDRLGDRDGTVPARVEDYDLAAGDSLGDGPRECLAGRYDGAVVRVGALLGDEATRVLGGGGSGAQAEGYAYSGDQDKQASRRCILLRLV